MAVLVVVVGEEGAAEYACVVQGGEGAGEDRAVFEGLECRLGIGVVVGDVRAEWLRVMFRSVSRVATFLEVIEVPLSAWM
jgi:hypothetical protein